MAGFAREHHCWHGNGDWDAECCVCADNSCKHVTTIQALWHLSIEREQNRQHWERAANRAYAKRRYYEKKAQV